jgi:hypothetical protein
MDVHVNGSALQYFYSALCLMANPQQMQFSNLVQLNVK